RGGAGHPPTGGLGPLAFGAPRARTRFAPVRLVLTARSPLPPREQWEAWSEQRGKENETTRRIMRVKALEAAGAEVLAVAADAGGENAMAGVLAEAGRGFGPVRGVVHAAGELGRGTRGPVRELA